MARKIDFEITDNSVVTIRPLTPRARVWLSEATEVAGIYDYEGGPLVADPELGHDLLGSLQNTDMELNIYD